MRVSVIKLGARISFNANDTSGGNGEARSIIKILHEGGADVRIITKILKKDNLLPEYTWLNSGDVTRHKLNESDALIVINGTVNFFGGAEDVEQLFNYTFINDFKGPVFYFLCDPALTLKQVWPSVQKKPWAGNWTEEGLNITRTDIQCICQPFNEEAVKKLIDKTDVPMSVVKHFPFEQFPCLNDEIPFSLSPDVDLSYGGTMRGGKRIAKMVKFYFGLPEDISVEMFGKIEASDFTSNAKGSKLTEGLRFPTFTGPVKYDLMLPKMNTSRATVIIGDPLYEEIDDVAQRAYESIQSSVVTFIDTDLDKMRRVYRPGNCELYNDVIDFLYVSSKDEVIERVRELKSNFVLREIVVEAQKRLINFDRKKYCDSLISILKAGVNTTGQ